MARDTRKSDATRVGLKSLVPFALLAATTGFLVAAAILAPVGRAPLALVLACVFGYATLRAGKELLRTLADTSYEAPEAIEDQDEVAAAVETVEDEQEETALATLDDEEESQVSLAEMPSPVGLDFESFAERITKSVDPINELKLFVGAIRTREAGEGEPPTPYESFAARILAEAGLFDRDVELPRLRIVRPKASKMLYLKILERQLSYLARTRVFALEAALNALRLSANYFEDPNERPVREHYQLLQRLTRSICAQSPNLNEGVPVVEDSDPDSEWAVRLGISTAIESLQLPQRLMADFRCNVADGNVAIRIKLTPTEAFPASAFVEGIGLIPASRTMRRKAASDYALRLALLVAASAFRCSDKVLHVWVSEELETANRTACYLSVDFDRWRFAKLDLADLGPLEDVYRSFAPALRYEEEILRPVAATFELREKRFCPAKRYEPVSLSSRKIPAAQAEALGTNHVSGLSIDESQQRSLVAMGIMGKLGDSTEKNVRAIMELAGDDPDPSVRSAAERTVNKLIEGTLENDALIVAEEFVSGDDLSRAVVAAREALQNQDPAEAERMLSGALESCDREGTYRDSSTVEYRFFQSYVDRALYNRLYAAPGVTQLLVPESYFEAHLLMGAALLMQGRVDEALPHARRIVELAPNDSHSRLFLVRCLEATQDDDAAIEELKHLLEMAHDAEGLGFAYYRMAYFMWRRGAVLAAQACYGAALSFMPGALPLVAMEMTALAMQNPTTVHEELTAEQTNTILKENGIPIAPTEQVSEALMECARASVDAEVFPVAKSFAQVLGSIWHDDIMAGIIRSLEDEPDF